MIVIESELGHLGNCQRREHFQGLCFDFFPYESKTFPLTPQETSCHPFSISRLIFLQMTDRQGESERYGEGRGGEHERQKDREEIELEER